MFGRAGGFSADFDLGLLNGMNGFAIRGVPGEDFTGTAVRGAGDVNGDGFADLIVGAFAVDAHGADSGASYLIYGKPGGFAPTFALASLDGGNGFRIAGAVAGELAGFAVSGAGDVNGDGFADLLIGAHRADAQGLDSGAGYVFFGFAAGTPQPSLTIGNVSQPEGDTGDTVFTFTVALSAASNETITVDYETVDESARAGEDYAAIPKSTLTFLPGEVTKQIQVLVHGDTIVEPTERFRVVLSNARNALLLDAVGDTKIRNDDFARPNPQTLVFPESDGDLVTIRVRGGGALLPGDATLADDGGIETLDLTRLAVPAHAGRTKPLNVFISVVPSANASSDGLTRVGLLEASGVALGKVKIAGHVGQFLIGGGTAGPKAAQSFSIAGDFGGLVAAPVVSQAVGNLGRFSVGGSVLSATLHVDGKLGWLSVVGRVENAAIFAGHAKKITIGGSLHQAAIFGGGFGAVSIGGNVEKARILAGYDKNALPVNADARIGKVTVNGDWTASSLVAGIADTTGDGFGRNDSVIAGDTTPGLLSKIAGILIRGRATGSAAAGDHFGITAQSIGKASIAGRKIALDKSAPDDLLLDPGRNDFRLVEVGA